MRSFFKPSGLILAFVALALLAACAAPAATPAAPAAGGSGASAGQPTTAAAPAAAQPTAASQAAAPKQLKKATLMLNWVPYGEHAPYFYGVEKGFYAAEGIDLDVQPGGGSGKTIQAVDAGQVMFGHADTPALVKAIEAGAKVKSVGVILQKGPGSVEYFADKGYKKPQDLKGVSVAVTPGDAVFQTFPAFLAANGMSMNDVKTVNVDASGKIATLIEGKVDTLIGFFNDQAATIENTSGKKVEYMLYADYGVNLLSNGIVVREDTLKNDADTVRAFLRATAKSWEEATKDKAGAVAAMAKRAEKAPPPNVLTAQWDRTIGLLHTKATEGKPISVNAESDWQDTINVLQKYADVQNPGKPSKYWDPSFAPK